jgi:hypothetical protein
MAISLLILLSDTPINTTQRYAPNIIAVSSPMHPYPKDYSRVADGDRIKEGDLALGKITAMCGRESYGWKNVAPHLIGQEFFEGALELGHPSILLRRSKTEMV